MFELLRDYVRYNVWANERLIQYFVEQTEGLLQAEVANSFPSIRATWLHNAAAEHLWLLRLQGISLKRLPYTDFEGDREGLFHLVRRNSKDFRDFVLAQGDAYLSEKIHCYTLNKNPFYQKRSEMIQHCMNHSTYHRGQIITMSKQLDLKDLPSTDLINYYRMRKAE